MRRPVDRVVERLAGSAGSHQRGSRISSSLEPAALDERREVAADRLDLGQLGHGEFETSRATGGE